MMSGTRVVPDGEQGVPVGARKNREAYIGRGLELGVWGVK